MDIAVRQTKDTADKDAPMAPISCPPSPTLRPTVVLEAGRPVVVSKRGLGKFVRTNSDGTWHIQLDSASAVDVAIADVMVVTHVGGSVAWQASIPPDRCSSFLPASAWQGRRAVLCFGDSLTEGLVSSDCPRSPYSKQLALHFKGALDGKCPVVINAGLSGETTDHMLGRLKDLLQFLDNTPVDVAIILGGTNDLGEAAPKQIIDNLLRLHKMVHAAGAMTGVLTIPACTYLGQEDYCKDDREQVNAQLRSFAAEQCDRTMLVDVAAAFPQADSHMHLWTSDGVHMSADGYQALGDLVASSQLPSISRHS